MMRSKKLVTAILAAASIMGGAVSVQVQASEDFEFEVHVLWHELRMAQENIEQNTSDITEIKSMSIILCKFFLTLLRKIRSHYKFEILGANAIFELEQELV